MNNNFQKGFEKTAFSVWHALGAAFLPSVERRIAEQTYETSKRKAMGLKPEVGTGMQKFVDRLEKDMDFVESLPKKSLRRKMNEFLMREGPGLVLYTPAEQGRSLGRALQETGKVAPDSIKPFLADLTSMDKDKSQAAFNKLVEHAKKFEKAKKYIGYGAAGGAGLLGLYGLSKLIDKKEEPPAQPLPQEDDTQSQPALQRL